MTAGWQAGPEPGSWGPGPPLLTTLHDVVRALRRQWVFLALAALLGASAGVGYAAWLSSTSTASMTIFLAHDPGVDEPTAVATDDRLLRARPVAQAVIDRLGLQSEPEEFQADMESEILTAQLLRVTVRAPDEDLALREADALAEAFLAFRSEQLLKQAAATTDQLSERVDGLEKEAASLTRMYNRLVNGNAAQQATASDVLTQRSGLVAQISTVQQQIEEISINADAVVTASQVVDPPVVLRVGLLRKHVLPVASGLIGGLGLGALVVVLLALTSERVRGRGEVAAALGVPVRYALGRITGVNPLMTRRRKRNRRLVVEALIAEGFGSPGTVSILATVDAADEASRALLEGLRRGLDEGPLCLVDLTDNGLLLRRQWSRFTRERRGDVVVLRSERPGVFVRSDEDLDNLAHGGEAAWLATTSSVSTVVLAEVDPGIGVKALASWSDTAILMVAAGRTTAARLHATADSFEMVGPRLRLAVLVDADERDASAVAPDSGPRAWEERPVSEG